MLRTFPLNTMMPNIPTIFLLSGAAAILALFGFLFVRKLDKQVNFEEHQGFLDAMLGIVGTLVSILLGLLVAAALDHYKTLEENVDAEAASIAQVFRMSIGLPDANQQSMRGLAKRYCKEVVNDEWPLMEKGEMSKKVLLTYILLCHEVASFHPANDGETNLHAALLTAIQQIGDGRRHRMMALHNEWTRNLMPMLIMCSAIVLGFAYLYVRRGAILHGVIICFVAVALGGNLGLVYLLSNPFSGDWKLHPKGFELNLQVLQDVKSLPELQDIVKNVKEE